MVLVVVEVFVLGPCLDGREHSLLVTIHLRGERVVAARGPHVRLALNVIVICLARQHHLVVFLHESLSPFWLAKRAEA